MKYEEILEILGDFGLYQKRVYFLLCLVAIPHSMQLMGIVFTMGNQNHRCAIPGLDNDTYQIQDDWHKAVIDTWIPMDSSTGMHSSCHIHARDSSSQLMTNTTVPCSRYVYDTGVFESTITSDLGLVCDRKSLTTYSNMIFMGGMLAGSIIMGTLSDTIGRKKIIVISVFVLWASSLSLAFVKNYISFVILRFIIAFSGISVFMTAHVVGIEIVGPKTRLLTGLVIELFFSLGLAINVLAAYFIRDWITLQIMVSAPTVLLMSYIFLVPESARWLIRKGRYREASDIIQKAARVNRVTLSDKEKNLEDTECDKAGANLWQMFTTKVLLIRTLVLMYTWYVVSLVYFGLSLNVGALSGNIYLNFALFDLVECLAYIACLLLLDRMGRKPMMCISFFMAGVACLSIMFPVMYGGSDVSWLTQTLSLVGKFGASVAFGIAYLYTAEMFPTSLRNSGIGLCSFSSRIGGIMAPYIADLGKIVTGNMGVALPSMVFGGAAVLAGFLTLLLPETTNRVLPESIQDAKEFGRNSPRQIYKEKDKTKEMSLLNGYETNKADRDRQLDDDLVIRRSDDHLARVVNRHTMDTLDNMNTMDNSTANDVC